VRVCFLSESSQSFDLSEYDPRVRPIHVRIGDPIPDAEVYVWDYTPLIKLESAISARRDRQHLILAEPDELNELDCLRAWACILLKPVIPFTLKAFLEPALKAWEVHAWAPHAETVRSEKGDFLQYLMDVNLTLQQYDRNRSNFLACALHDLRTPLTAIHGYCGLLAEEKLGSLSAAQRELLQRVQYSTRRLMRLTSGAFGVVTEGRMAKRRSYPESDIEEALTRALHDIDPLVRDKGITVEAELTPPTARLSFEPEQIQQVFINLLENSCKFVPRNGKIEIRGYHWSGGKRLSRQRRLQDKPQRVTNGYRIDIVDSGPGIPCELAEKIFEPYSSFLEAPDRSAGGLGLAICRNILLAHQGAIWATPSSAAGQFSFVLPIDNAKGNFNPGWAGTPLELGEAAS
jgi:signal transduction histidine kinase